MARVAVLDADVLIGHLDDCDAHHERARDVLRALAGERADLRASTITLAEVLVAPEAAGRGDAARSALQMLAVEEVRLGVDAARRLAALRASTGCRMPDCCVLLAVEDAEATLLATFDERLRKSAGDLGIDLAGVGG